MRIPRALAISLCAAFVAGSGLADRAAATDQFPYTVYANSEDVYIRSGPGKNYYPTPKLKNGEPGNLSPRSRGLVRHPSSRRQL